MPIDWQFFCQSRRSSALSSKQATTRRRGGDVATEYVTQGQRIARARHRKGWDQATLAEKIGRSVSWLSKVENGRMPLDRMSVVGQLAEVLRVEVAELTGQPYQHETAELDSGHAAVPGLRLALQQASLASRVVLPAPGTADASRTGGQCSTRRAASPKRQVHRAGRGVAQDSYRPDRDHERLVGRSTRVPDSQPCLP
ncbi:helix-turn-helix transcriptional regulator [Nonomuraea sp. NPDC026600]|uniref:helix-turn-helix domain-containing protein n=1 Tax=Nonomuraea sp. NPDC026600 TaxID=3155363 RepID=UPI0033DB0933